MNKMGKIKWSVRLKQEKLSQLYKLHAKMIIDSDLLQDVAVTLYLRCKDIMAIYDAHYNNRVRCPGCYAGGTENYLILPKGLSFREKDSYIFDCERCGFSFSWLEFRKSHNRKQLNAGGAGAAFMRFIEQYERNLSDNALMLEVDRLIHEFHYSLRSQPDLPTRIAGANLIDGKTTTDIIRFLDELTYSVADNSELFASAQKWRGNINYNKSE